MMNAIPVLGNNTTNGNLTLILAIAWILESEPTNCLFGHYSSTRTKRFEHDDLIESSIMLSIERSERTGNVIKIMTEGDNFYDTEQEFFEFDDFLSVEEIAFYFNLQKKRAIWLLDNMEGFKNLVEDLVNERYHYLLNGHYWIIYTNVEEPNSRVADLERMFQKLFEIYVLNVNILILENDQLTVYTYYPFQEQGCTCFEPVIDFVFPAVGEQCEYEREVELDPFQNKLENMHECEIKVITWPYEPFMLIEYADDSTSKINSMHGIEGMILSLLSEKMNFRMQIAEPPKRDRGYYFPNGTATGAIKMIADGDANLTILCITIDKLRSEVSWPSYPYLYIPVVVAIPSGNPMSPFVRLMRPFKYKIWSYLGATVILGILTIYLVKWKAKPKQRAFLFGRYNRTPFTNFWCILYGVSVPTEPPHGNFGRFVFILMILYFMILRTVYVGQLFKILQDGRSAVMVQSLQEVVALNYTFFTFPTLTKAITGATNPRVILRFIDEQHTPKMLFDNINLEDTNYVVSLLHYTLRAYNQKASNRNRTVNVLKQKVITSPICLYMRKHSYLLSPINDFLLLLMSSGFVDHFEDQYLEEIGRHKSGLEPVPLSYARLSGLFVIYFVLLTMCVFVLLIELYSLRSRRVERLLHFLNY